jgi:hypothetical protein
MWIHLFDLPTKIDSCKRLLLAIVVRCQVVRPITNSILDLLATSPYRCFGTTLYLAAGSHNLVLANCVVPYQLNLWLVHRFLSSESTYFISNFSPCLGGLSVLILCCCPTWPNLMVIFHLIIILVNARRVWNLSKNPYPVAFDNWVMFSSAICLIFGSPPCWFQTLWLPLLAIPSFCGACSYNPIYATWNFIFVVRLVMVLWVATDGATMKLGASYGCRHMAGCLARAGIVVSSHDRL